MKPELSTRSPKMQAMHVAIMERVLPGQIICYTSAMTGERFVEFLGEVSVISSEPLKKKGNKK